MTFFYKLRDGQIIDLSDISRTDPLVGVDGQVRISLGHGGVITVQRDKYQDIEAELMEHGMLEPDETPSRAIMGDVIRRFVAINEKLDERGGPKYLRAYQDLYRVSDGRSPIPAEVLALKWPMPHQYVPSPTSGFCECRYAFDGTIDDTRIHYPPDQTAQGSPEPFEKHGFRPAVNSPALCVVCGQAERQGIGLAIHPYPLRVNSTTKHEYLSRFDGWRPGGSGPPICIWCSGSEFMTLHDR